MKKCIFFFAILILVLLAAKVTERSDEVDETTDHIAMGEDNLEDFLVNEVKNNKE